jgi:general secretion pathway protein L
LKLYITADAPYHWFQLSNGGKVKKLGEAAVLTEVPARKSDQIVVVLPGEEVLTTRVTIPTRSRAKLIQAIPFALEDQLTEDVDEFYFIVLNWKPTQPATVAALSKPRVRAWKQVFKDAGLRIHSMVADYQLLPIHPRTSLTIASHNNGKISVHRDDNTGATMESDTLEMWWQGLTEGNIAAAVNDVLLAQRLVVSGSGQVKEWNLGQQPSDWIGHFPRNHRFSDLLEGTTEQQTRQSTSPVYVAATVLLGLALSGKIAVDHYEYFQLEQESRRLQKETHALFSSTFPEEKRVVNARSQFRQKIVEISQQGNTEAEFQNILFAVTQAVVATRSIVEEISYREKSLMVLCSVNNFAGLDTLQKRLEAYPGVKVQLVSSGSLGTRVTGRFKVNRKGA